MKKYPPARVSQNHLAVASGPSSAHRISCANQRIKNPRWALIKWLVRTSFGQKSTLSAHHMAYTNELSSRGLCEPASDEKEKKKKKKKKRKKKKKKVTKQYDCVSYAVDRFLEPFMRSVRISDCKNRYHTSSGLTD